MAGQDGVGAGILKAGGLALSVQVNNLQKQGRVQSYGEANYTEGSQTAMWLKNAISEIAELIVTNRQRALGDKIGKPPKHLE